MTDSERVEGVERWPFDSERVWIGVPWHDEGEDWDPVRGTAEVVEAGDEHAAKFLISQRTSAEWVDVIEMIPASRAIPTSAIEGVIEELEKRADDQWQAARDFKRAGVRGVMNAALGKHQASRDAADLLRSRLLPEEEG